MSFPISTLLDDFERADENPIATNWSGPTETGFPELQISSGMAGGLVANFAGSWYDLDTFGPDCAAYGKIGVVAGLSENMTIQARVVGEGTSTVDAYAVRYANSGGTPFLILRRYDNSSATDLASKQLSSPMAADDLLGIVCIEDIIELWTNIVGEGWKLQLRAQDATHSAAGRFALQTSGGSPLWEEFFGGTLQLLQPSADIATGGWTTAPLWSKENDLDDATLITAMA